MQYINLNNVQRVGVYRPKDTEMYRFWIEWTVPETNNYNDIETSSESWEFWKKETAEGIAMEMAAAANNGIKFYLFPEERYIQDHNDYKEYYKSLKQD